MPTDSDAVVAIAAGLGAMTRGADLYYHRLSNRLGAVVVKPPRGGFGDADETYVYYEAEFDRLSDYGRRPIIIIGHSLGGLNAIRYTADNRHVILQVLVGVPLTGSGWLKAMRFLAPLDRRINELAPILRQLTPDSTYLATLQRDALYAASRSLCIEAAYDTMVIPASSCHVSGARQYRRFEAPWINHVTMIAHWAVIRLIADKVNEAKSLATSSA